MDSVIQPNQWVVLKLPSESTKVLQIVPNTTISLGKYGTFPSNLVIHRPFHLTYEIRDRLDGDSFSRLRVVPPAELYADTHAEEPSVDTGATTPNDADQIITAADEAEFNLVDTDSGAVVAKSNREIIDDTARQTLTFQEIEELKKNVTDAGKDIIAKLILSHSAIDQKTSFSLAKYKLSKTRKYIRRFQIVPLDVASLAKWLLEVRHAAKILDLRDETIALLGCWSNVHFGGEDAFLNYDAVNEHTTDQELLDISDVASRQFSTGRWLVVDDTGGLLVAAMAEKMGILYPPTGAGEEHQPGKDERPPQPFQKPDFMIPYSQVNTLTLIHAQSQPRLPLLTYYGFDAANPKQTSHPLSTHLLTLTWLQLLDAEADTSYSVQPPIADAEQLASWKPNRRGHYHRKRRRHARTRYAVEAARCGGFAGLAVAAAMDPVSILRHTLPLLTGGASIAVYSPTLEPLAELADCFSVGRRSAWTASTAEREHIAPEDLERWEGSPEFPVNPSLLLGVTIQTSRPRRWQVLPGRTHPLMTDVGGAEGYVFTGWKVRPAEGKVEARGRYKRRKAGEDPGDNVDLA